MKVTYKKLWILCAEQEISKAELRKRAGLSSATFTKLRKNQEVNLSVLLKIADVMDCNAGEDVYKRQASRPSAPPPRTFRNTTTAMAIPGRLTSGPNGF